MKRTMIEITVIEGSFSDEELIDLCKGLEPVDTKQMIQILNTPFAFLCYSNRHKKTASEVPLSYWKYKRQTTWSMNSIPVSKALPPIHIPESYGYNLNSVFSFGTPAEEIEYYYEHEKQPGSYIRVLVTPYGKEYSIPYPAILGDQTCKTQVLDIKNNIVYHVCLKEERGPHEVIFRQKDSVILLLVKPASWTSIQWLHQLLNDII